VHLLDTNPTPNPISIYSPEDTAETKINKIAREVYGAANVEFGEGARNKLARFTAWGFGNLPICIAKTQYSLSDDPSRPGAPTGWTLHITDLSLSAGAGFLVAIAGNMMLMPGLPKLSRASGIDVDQDGNITGLV